MSSLTEEQKQARKCANALLGKEIEPGDVPQELIPYILDSFERHTKTMKAFKDYAKKQMFEGLEVKGWFVKPGNPVRKFTKLVELSQHLKKEYNCNAETFRAACSISTGGVKDIIKAGLPPGTPASQIEHLVNQCVTNYGTTKQNADSIAPLPKSKAKSA